MGSYQAIIYKTTSFVLKIVSIIPSNWTNASHSNGCQFPIRPGLQQPWYVQSRINIPYLFKEEICWLPVPPQCRGMVENGHINLSCWGYMDRLRHIRKHSQIAKFMGQTWGPPGSCRPQMGPMLVPWTLLSGLLAYESCRTMPRCVLSQHPLCMISLPWHDINTLRPRWNSRHFPNDISKSIFLTENSWFSLKISLKFVLSFVFTIFQQWFR